ncbi:hypothetical protein PanWU01x14_287290 [Parasponia andersonii]|uniref:Uncharacterized protein n=1 Tax=Parasponia andersonii TaxID=3476 RepID=A0A2P5AZ00_PARAD|nr:hypothetical protein PanWU01x14_287290 [Parasponia andersonii]
MTSELQVSIDNITRRLKQLNQFKDSGSVRVGQIERLQEMGEQIRKSYEDRKPSSRNNKQARKRLTLEMEALKMKIEAFDASLDVYEEKFRKYNVPRRFQMKDKPPLKTYQEQLQEFMKTNWRKEAEKSREKEQRSLIEWMEMFDQSNDEDKIAVKSLKIAFSELGIRISRFFMEYFFLIMAVSNKSDEIMALSLYEVKAVLKCLTVEENSKSIVIKTFLSMVQLFEGAMNLAGSSLDEAKGRKSKADGTDEEKVMFFLDDKIEDDLLHLIIIEVLRLEVSFCSPDMPMKVTNDVAFSMANHLLYNVFWDKLNRVGTKIDGLKSDIQFVHDEYSSEMKFFREVLDAGVEELWTELIP